jgi:hypothetical protein
MMRFERPCSWQFLSLFPTKPLGRIPCWQKRPALCSHQLLCHGAVMVWAQRTSPCV